MARANKFSAVMLQPMQNRDAARFYYERKKLLGKVCKEKFHFTIATVAGVALSGSIEEKRSFARIRKVLRVF